MEYFIKIYESGTKDPEVKDIKHFFNTKDLLTVIQILVLNKTLFLVYEANCIMDLS